MHDENVTYLPRARCGLRSSRSFRSTRVPGTQGRTRTATMRPTKRTSRGRLRGRADCSAVELSRLHSASPVSAQLSLICGASTHRPTRAGSLNSRSTPRPGARRLRRTRRENLGWWFGVALARTINRVGGALRTGLRAAEPSPSRRPRAAESGGSRTASRQSAIVMGPQALY
jgi:hypothetical protein